MFARAIPMFLGQIRRFFGSIMFNPQHFVLLKSHCLFLKAAFENCSLAGQTMSNPILR